MNEKRLIKKYGNRRLYDVQEKSYLTQEDLVAQIQAGLEVQVIDSKTGEDLTQLVLIQIILEMEKSQTSRLFSAQMLHQLIQFQDESQVHYMVDFFQRYLPNILYSYMQWQQSTQQHFFQWAQANWSMNPYSQNFWMPGWQAWQQMFSYPFGSVKSSVADASEVDSEVLSTDPVLDPSLEIERLKQKLHDLENHLKNAS